MDRTSKTKEEKMISLKITFGHAVTGHPRVSLFALVLLILAIDDDRQDREEKRRKKRDAKPPAGPRPR